MAEPRDEKDLLWFNARFLRWYLSRVYVRPGMHDPREGRGQDGHIFVITSATECNHLHIS